MRRTSFSILVSCYNFSDFLPQCLDSILGQKYPRDYFEVICVDDGSTDKTPSILREYKKRSDRIIDIRIENSGLEKACNTAIGKARFDRIMRVDSDDFLADNYLEIMDGATARKPRADFFYTKTYFEYYSDHEKYEKTLPDFDPEEIFGRGDFFATGTVYQKEDLETVGLFQERVINCGLENYEVILALLSAGKQGFAVDGTAFFYRRHKTNMSTMKREGIVQYGKGLLQRYGRPFRTNLNHPYGLKLEKGDQGGEI